MTTTTTSSFRRLLLSIPSYRTISRPVNGPNNRPCPTQELVVLQPLRTQTNLCCNTLRTPIMLVHHRRRHHHHPRNQVFCQPTQYQPGLFYHHAEWSLCSGHGAITPNTGRILVVLGGETNKNGASTTTELLVSEDDDDSHVGWISLPSMKTGHTNFATIG